MKWNYIAIPIVVLCVAYIGRLFTESGLSWLWTLQQPSWTPDGSVIGLVWLGIYLCMTAFALIIWNTVPRKEVGCEVCVIFGLLIFNALLNVLWSYFFFVLRSPGLAFFDLLLLEATNIYILYTAYQVKRWTVWLIVPYVLWVAFAGILNYLIYTLN